ncbi:MFS transporter, partial [Candidatus Bathyarchaeota archaeon]|nr:MFS transporter [Candidatus Bathyarchaeota archaeon]
LKSKTAKKSFSLLNYGLFVMTITHTLNHVFTRIHPALFPVFRVEFGLSLQQFGIIDAIPSLCSTILTIPSGFLTDKLGSRTILIISFLISGIGAIALSQSVNLIMLTISLSAVIITQTLYHPAAYTYVSKLFSEKDMSKSLGIQNAGGPLGMSLGPLSLSLLVGILGWKWRSLYLFWAFPILAIIITIWKLKPQVLESEKKEKEREKKMEEVDNSPRNSLLSTGLIIFLIYVTLRAFGSRVLGSFIPTYLHDVKELTVLQASIIYGSVSLFGVIAAPLGGYLADRFGNKRWLMLSVTISALSLFTAPLAPNASLFIGFYFLSTFFSTSAMSVNSAIIAKLTPSKQRGMGFALFFLPGSIIGAVAPIVGATIAVQLGLSSLFPVSVAITFISLIVLTFGVKI